MRAIPDLMASLSALTDGSVRQIRKTAEDPPRISVIDVVSLVTGHTHHQAAQTLQRLLDDYPEVSSKIAHFRFSGRGQRDTPVTDAYGITEVVMLLRGKTATDARKQAASVLVRYLGGDLSMISEIAENRLSQEEMSEDDPARIFGETVESDVVKRKR